MANDDNYELKFACKNVCLRMSNSGEGEEDIMKEGYLEVKKGVYGHILTWTPNDEADRDLAIVFHLKELRSFTRVVPMGGLYSFMVFNLKTGISCLPLEFRSGGTRELIRSFQGLMEYKRSESNQNEYLVCETSPEAMCQAMHSLNLSLESSLPPAAPAYPAYDAPAHYSNASAMPVPQQLWRHAPSKAKAGVRFVGRMVRDLMTERPRLSEMEVDSGVSRLREEDFTLPMVSREDSGFEVLSKKSSLPQVERPKVVRIHPLSETEWQAHLDPRGRVTCHEEVLEKIFKGGVDPDLRSVVWKYLLDYFKWGKTAEENAQLAEKRKDEYYAMKYQWRSMFEDQMKKNSLIRDRKLQIEKDVKRTDRTLEFFRDEEGENMRMLYDILMTYTMYNFDLGYVQGMNDLLSPILILMPTEHDAFWCFAGLMDRMEHNFEVDQAGMKQQLQQLSSLTQTIDEELFDHLERAESQNMYFCFRWLLLHFKREFSAADSMRLYEVLWTGLPCPNFHLLVAMAILDAERTKILELKPDLTEILKHINEIALRIDLGRCLCVAEGIFLQMRQCDDLPDDIVDIFGLNETRSFVSSPSQHSAV